MKRKIIQIFAFIMVFILFISCPLSAYASEKWEGSLGLTLYYNKDKILQYFKDTGEFWLYGASQMGAIVKADFVSFAENKKKMDDILSDGDKIGVYVDENDKAKGMYFSKEFMAQLKALLEEYMKTEQTKEENGGFYLLPTICMDDLPATFFKDAMSYKSFKGVVTQKGMLAVMPKFSIRYNSFVACDPFDDKENDTVLVEAGDSWSLDGYKADNKSLVNVRFYDPVKWEYKQYEWKYC